MLVPHFADGTRLRYVLDEADALGRLIDLRRVSGQFIGQATPIVRKGTDEVVGATANPPRSPSRRCSQIIYVRFLPSYVDSLRLYGLGNADALVRARIFAVAARDYAGVNVEFRDTPPTDFALYSEVDVEGPDPNALGLLGYDNTPGKDVGNQRLFDRIGGVNATTQSDGFPGYGGIFAENFLGFSAHPSSRVARLEVDPSATSTASSTRPPRHAAAGQRRRGARRLVGAGDGSAPASLRTRSRRPASAAPCSSSATSSAPRSRTRPATASASPIPPARRSTTPATGIDRLMDAGGDRPFEERAELAGPGPGRLLRRRVPLPAHRPARARRRHRRFDRASRLQLK